jgi:L-asparaginase/Glu-tRNA(Gln) amidotransferase subunit D
MVSWIKYALSWMVTHPWPIVAAVASALAVALFRRRPAPVVVAGAAAARSEGRAEVAREHADALEVVAERINETVVHETVAAEVSPTPAPGVEASDADVAAWLNGRLGQ